MMKILIVEDEAGIRNALLESFDWSALGCTACGAASGIEAMDQCLQSPPNILITDIVVPGIDGITLVRYLKQKFTDIRFIIITGHRDFEYAKDSLNLGASAFLLKPINCEELRDSILRVIESINAEYEHARQTDMSAPEEKFLSSLMNGYIYSLNEVDQSIRQIISALGTYYIAVMEFDLSDNETVTNLHSLSNLYKTLRTNASVLSARMNDYRLAFLVPVHNLDSWTRDARQHFSMFQRRVQEMFHYTVSVGISGLSNDISAASGAFIEAVRAAGCKFFTGKNSINFSQTGMAPLVEQASSAYADIEFVDAIQDLLSNGEPFFLGKQADKFFDDIQKNSPTDIEKCKSEIFCIIMMCLDRISHNSTHNLAQFLQKYNFFKNILLADTLERIKELFLSILIDLKDYNSIKSCTNKQYIVEKALAYLDGNYAETITLSSVAHKLYLSPAYLSTLISSETGKTFIDTLNGLRIKKAIELLHDTSLKNYVIAEKVGFKEPQYFSIVFKKYTGVSPQEYRQMYLSGVKQRAATLRLL